MSFEHPWLLALLPLSTLLLLWEAFGRQAAVSFPESPPARPSLRVRLLPVLAGLQCIALASLILAAAGPHTGSRTVYSRRNARDIIIALDTSESMRALDFGGAQEARSRLDGAVEMAGEFLRRRDGDRVGLVVFGGRAVTQCPLTFDRELALWLLGEVRPEMAGKRTALGEGIALGVARMSQRGGALVVISDGENTAGRVAPTEAGRLARSRSVRVYTIGIGSGGSAPVPVRLPSGRTVLRARTYRLDEAALREVAEASGGRYFRASDADALRQVLAEIDTLEPLPTPVVRHLPMGRRGAQLALLAAACLGALTAASSLLQRTAPLLR